MPFTPGTQHFYTFLSIFFRSYEFYFDYSCHHIFRPFFLLLLTVPSGNLEKSYFLHNTVEQPELLYRPELLGEYLYTHSFIHIVSVRHIVTFNRVTHDFHDDIKLSFWFLVCYCGVQNDLLKKAMISRCRV